MHIIIGGAYNGKTNYIENLLQGQPYEIYAGTIPATSDAAIIVIKDFENMIVPGADELAAAQEIFTRILNLDATVYCVCTDIGRGIVPMDKEERFLRDALGRLYQLLMQEAETVTRIWYGLAERLK